MKDMFAAMEAGEVIVGHWVASASTTMVELVGHSGADVVAIDCEHGALSPYGPQLEACVRAAYAADVAPIVRVPSHDGVQIANVADAGAKGIIVPHVNTPQELEDAIAHVKYPPLGNRGCSSTVPAARFGFQPWDEYLAEANATVEVIPLLEEPRVFQDLDAVLAVEHLRAVAIGPVDLAARLGGVGDPGASARVEELLAALVAACAPRNISVIDGAWDLETFQRKVAAGVKGIMYATDVSLLAGAIRTQMGPVRDFLAAR
jgi:2-keto-3-deoxy-L-rhamnonate aldolase RhmA